MPLPPGFELDDPAINLPAGFELEGSVQQQDMTIAPKERGVTQVPWWQGPQQAIEMLGAKALNYVLPQKKFFSVGPGQNELRNEAEPAAQSGMPLIQPQGTYQQPQGNWLQQMAAGMTTPGNILEAPLAMMPATRGLPLLARANYALQGAGGAVGDVSTIATTDDPEQRRQAVTSLPMNLGMAIAPAYDLRGPVREPLEQSPLGMPRALRTDAQTLGDIFDDLRASLDQQRSGRVTPETTPAPSLEVGSKEPAGEISAVQGRPVAPPAPVGVDPTLENIRPAIRLMNGEEVVGEKGQIHDEIITTKGLTPQQIDRRGFKDLTTNEWLDREALPDSGQAVPGMHANDLAATQEKGGDSYLSKRKKEIVAELEEYQPKITAEEAQREGHPEYEGQIPWSREPRAEQLRNELYEINAKITEGELTPEEQSAEAARIDEGTPQEQVDFQHELNSAAQAIKGYQQLGRITQEQADEFSKRGDALFAEGGTKEKAAALRQEVLEAGKTMGSPTTQQGSFLTQRQPKQLDQSHVANLGLSHGEDAVQALTKLQQKGDVYGRQRSEIAKFLIENFGHVLRSAKVLHGAEPQIGRAAYQGKEHTIHLGVGFDSDLSIPDRLIHEAVHAATLWSLDYGRNPTALAARARLLDLMEQSKKRLDKDGLSNTYGGLGYRHGNLAEFVAGLFDSSELRNHLNSFVVGGRTLLSRVWDAVKDIIGIKSGSAADEAFDIIANLGKEVNLADINQAREAFNFDPIGAGQTIRNVAPLAELERGEAIEQLRNKYRGVSAPLHTAKSEKLGNAIINYAASEVAPTPAAKWAVTDALQDKWRDTNFQQLMGAAIVEDNLNGLRQWHIKQGNPTTAAQVQHVWQMPGSPIHSQVEWQKVTNHPRMKDAIDRWKATVQATAEARHVELGGSLRDPGPETGAFLNLQAILDPANVGNIDSLVYSKQGQLTNPMLKGSLFSKQAKGTAEQYEFNIRKLGERMIKGNYARYALEQYYKAAVEEGVAFWQRPDKTTGKLEQFPMGIDPKNYTRTEVIRKGTGPGMTRVENFWLRNDLMPEFEQARKTDSPLRMNAMRMLGEVITSAQIAGPTDLFAHIINEIANIATSPGGGSFIYDLIRKAGAVPIPVGGGAMIPGPVGVIDAVVRLSWNAFQAFAEHADLNMKSVPETQRRIAQFSEIGAGRSAVIHEGLMEKGMKKALPGSEKLLPQHWSARALKAADRGGRLAKDKMFDAMVKDYGMEDNAFNRREFINQLGQYEPRLMSAAARFFREGNISPFVVAGVNFNRNAIRQMLMGVGPRSYKALDPVGHAKLRVLDALGLVSVMFAMPVAFNLLNTGKPNGRPGTPPGMVDMGGKPDEHGKHKVFDPAQLTLYRRGQRLTGYQALRTARSEGLDAKQTTEKMAGEMFDAFVHPWAGPAVNFGVTAWSGRQFPTGYLVSKNPMDTSENIVAALKNSQPQIAAYFKGKDEGKKAAPAVGGAMAQSLGVKSSRSPTMEEKGALTGPLRDRAKAVKEGKTPLTGQQKRSAGERAYWRGVEREDTLVGSLPKEQQDWLSTNSLRVPAFKPEQTVRGVRVPETKEEQRLSAELVAKETKEAVAIVMARGLPVQQSQKLLDRMLEQRHRRVRAEIRRRMATLPPSYEIERKQPIPTE